MNTVLIIVAVVVVGGVIYKFTSKKKNVKPTPKTPTGPVKNTRNSGGGSTNVGVGSTGGSYYSGKR